MFGPTRLGRQRWRREIDESKIDMGLLAPWSQEAADLSLYSAVLDNDHLALRALAASAPGDIRPDANMPVSGKLGEPEGTLLHFAARHCTLRTVIALLQFGADPHRRDSEGATPRDVARQRPSGARLRTVLELWENREKSQSAAPDEAADTQNKKYA